MLAAFVLTHNLGFDDIAHLKYLSDINEGTFFPVFIEVREEWSVARYPLFGLMVKTLGFGLPGADFFLYYVLGSLIFIVFLATCYEKIFDHSYGTKRATTVYLLVLAISIAASFDNYLNFGLYPVQQAKLLFLTGLVHLVAFWRGREDALILFLGGALLALSLIYHFNMMLLVPVVIALGVFITLSQRKNPRALSAIAIVMIIPIMIGALAMKKEGGFIHHQPKIVQDISGEAEVKIPELSVFEKYRRKLIGLVGWIKDGHYRDYYFARVYSAELILVPGVVFAGLSAISIPFSFPASITVFLILLSLQAVKLPHQIASGLLQSGPWFIAIDFARAEAKSELKKTPVLWTDEYTALVLRGMGLRNVQGLTHKLATLVFSPLVGVHAYRDPIWRDTPEIVDGSFLLNSRYWGVGSSRKFGHINPTPIPDITRGLNELVLEGRRYHTRELTRQGLDFLSGLFFTPLIEIPVRIGGGKSEIPVLSGTKQVFFFRDVALINYGQVKAGSQFRMSVEGKGDFFEVIYRTDRFAPLRQIPAISHVSDYQKVLEDQNLRVDMDVTERELVFLAKQSIDQLQIIVILETGHYSGLGEIDGIRIDEDRLGRSAVFESG